MASYTNTKRGSQRAGFLFPEFLLNVFAENVNFGIRVDWIKLSFDIKKQKNKKKRIDIFIFTKARLLIFVDRFYIFVPMKIWTQSWVIPCHTIINLQTNSSKLQKYKKKNTKRFRFEL